MTAWAAGMRITSSRLLTPTVTTVSTGTSNSSGWSVTTFNGRKVNGVVEVYVLVNRTGAAITATSGNISDTDVCTLPSGWRPLDNIGISYGNGSMDGEGIINTSGLVQIRSANANIGNDTNIRFYATFITG